MTCACKLLLRVDSADIDPCEALEALEATDDRGAGLEERAGFTGTRRIDGRTAAALLFDLKLRISERQASTCSESLSNRCWTPRKASEPQ